VLSADEIARADRFVTGTLRSHFAVGRGLTRVILASYTGVAPAEIAFAYGPQGKPSLAHPESRLRFNISHSHGVALFAVTIDRDVGVDVERVRPDISFEAIAEDFFSPEERDVLRAVPGPDKARAFFDCWTRKEAFIKARGDGLSLPLDQFVVSLELDVTQALLATRWDRSEAERWAVAPLETGPGYRGAIAVESRSFHATRWLWSGGPTARVSIALPAHDRHE